MQQQSQLFVTFLQAAEKHLATIAADIHRIADHFNPAPADIVDSPYVARLLGCTTTWIADMARKGEIPGHCIVSGTGHGKPWKFYRGPIE